MTEKNSTLNANSESLHTDDGPVRKIGGLIVLVTFGIFGVWSYFAPMDSSALAPGVVTVKSFKKTVQHLDGGIVAKILVKDGDLVKESDTLIVLDDTQIKAQLGIAFGQYLSFAAQVARLEAERDLKAQIDFSKMMDVNGDSRAQEARLAETNAFLARKNAYEGQIAVLQQRVSQISSKVQGLRAQIDSKQSLVASFAEEIKDLKELLVEGFADKQRVRELERQHALQTGEIAQLNAEVATNQLLISETRLQILQLQKQFQEDVAGKLSEAQTQLNDANQRVNANRDKLERILIKAPSAGMVMGLAIHTEGGVIPPGQPILDIVPQDAELVIEAQVSPMDIDRVSVGLQAEVRFSAFKQSKTPRMFGQVSQLSADRLVDQKSGAPYYLARVELTPDSRQALGKLQLLPGMPAEVLINTGERTLFEYLAQPATNAIARSFIED